MNWDKYFGLQKPSGDLDVLTIGETVVDLISVERTDDLFSAQNFERFQGGSPANIALNIANLQGKSAVVSKIGRDGFGRFLRSALKEAGVGTEYLYEDEENPTTVNIISRSSGTADSIHLRFADFRLNASEITPEMIKKSKIVHGSSFALSREPSREALKKAFDLAKRFGKLISLDPNYNPIDWLKNDDPREILTYFFQYAHVTKPSFDDAVRFFGSGYTPEEYIQKYHLMGPQVVVFTMGDRGTILSVKGRQRTIPARKINVVDATGAGDAFWAGFLIAFLDDKPLLECVLFGREIVELGLSTVGPLKQNLNRDRIYEKVIKELKNASY